LCLHCTSSVNRSRITMSDEESEEEEEVITLDEVQRNFHKQVGHKPHSVQQLLAFCKQNNYPHKFKDINQWWPTRPDPAEKPKQQAINADDYRTEEEKLSAEKNADADGGDAAQDNEEKDADEDEEEADKGDADADKEDEPEPAAEKEANNDDGGGDAGDGDGDEDEEEEEEEEEEDEDEED